MSRLRFIAAILLLAVTCIALGAQPAHAQTPAIPGNPATEINQFFFHPRIVMAGADRIGLSRDQRQRLRELWEASQVQFRRQRFELGNAMTSIGALAVQHPVDEERILAQLDHVLDLEREIKRAQLLMLVRVKNLLTPDQHVILDEMRRNQQQRRRQQDH